VNGPNAMLAALFLVTALTGCAGPRYDVPRLRSEAWPQPEETALGRALGEQLAGHEGESGFYLLDTGMEALSIRAGLAENAQHSLDLQYYIVRDDATAQLLLYRVLRAARRGVRVRLLIDDLYSGGKNFDLAIFAAQPNIEVRVFNPFRNRGTPGLMRMLEFFGDAARLNRRMHNKLWIADNAAAIVGGRNLGDEYFDAHGEINFSDLDVLSAGPVVRDISRSFDDYWNSEWAVPVQAFSTTPPDPKQVAGFGHALETRLERFRDTDYARELREVRLGPRLLAEQLPLTPAHAIALYDEPTKISAVSGTESSSRIFPSRIRPIVETARHEVIMISPYFIPSEQGIAILCALARRGVHVRILTNSLASTDVPVVHAGYARVRGRLLAAGVELYEARPDAPPKAIGHWRPGASSGASLHTKAIVVDRKSVLVGSMNLDPRSRLSNTEVALLIDSPALGEQLGTLFEKATSPDLAFRVELAKPGLANSPLIWTDRDAGRTVHFRKEPLASWWRRMISSLLGVLAPEELL
jgi:putative cardiolipin synthase